MKTINPFKRRNKEDFIPCSLFPASKVCDTSMNIGRVTPLYALDMVAGNRVSLDVSQLTRFQPMLAPVMTNYSVEFGAFYVPYVALDEFFTSTWFRTNMQGTDVLRKGVLRAREFFNPAIENSEKVHPWFFTTQRCGKRVNWVGSLYDHLRAPLGLPDWSTDKVYSSAASVVDDSSEVNAWLNSTTALKNANGDNISVANLMIVSGSTQPVMYGHGQLTYNGKPVFSPLQLILQRYSSFEWISAVQKQRVTAFMESSQTYQDSSSGQSYTARQLCSMLCDLGKFYEAGASDVDRTDYFIEGLPGADFGHSSLSTTSFLGNVWPYVAKDQQCQLISLFYTACTGKVANGVFTYNSSGKISYSVASVPGQTALLSLFDSLYSGVYTLYNVTESGSRVSSPFVQFTVNGGDFLNFLLWVPKQYHLLDGNYCYDRVLESVGSSSSHPVGVSNAYLVGSASDDSIRTYQLVMRSLNHWFFGFDDGGTYMSYEDLLGKNTIQQVQNAYRSFVESEWISANRSLEWNSVYWLTYQRIYADWFLNEHYTKHEDYLDMVGSGYLAGFQSLDNGDGKTMDDWFSAGMITDGNNPKVSSDATLSYFADRIAKGECMPVLWSLDCVTNLIQSTSVSSTPVGQSITENFYNRFYARFKDLINRMGPDYRRNARALYGKGPDDASLLRSQVVGYRSFDVQIGDVAQNSESTQNSTLGQFAGYAVSRDKAGSFDWTAQESGVFMVLAWVRPKYTCFSDLVPRSLYKREYMDYLIPQFGGVGYQDFANKQLNPTDSNPDSRLGYEERYSEYMMMDNECSGLMRTSMSYYNSNRIGTPCYTPGTADYYHLLYMDEESDLNRVFVDNANDPVLISAYFNGNVTRQLPASIKTEF